MKTLTLLTFSLMGCSGRGFIEGEIGDIGPVAAKAVESGYQRKVRLVVKTTKIDPKFDDATGDPSGVVIECWGTRCADISAKTCHRFQCQHGHRGGVHGIFCKHNKEIECLASTE